MTQFFQGQIKGTNRIEGATDSTQIGNMGDALKVTYAGSNNSNTTFWSKYLRYDDMNASNGGVARGTTISGEGYTTVYSYNGYGYISGLVLNVETFSGWTFRLQVDSNTIFEFVDTDLTTDTLYDMDDATDANQAEIGISKSSHDRFVWHSPLNIPLQYSSNVTVSVKRSGGAKKFQAGLIILTKEV